MTENPLLAAALSYAARGWRVAPLHDAAPGRPCSCGKAECGSAGKHPRTKNGLSDGTTDPGVIRGWLAKWPTANVAIVCGPDSGVWVVGPDGDRGMADLRALAEGREPIPAGPVSATQGGGEHLLFAWPADGGPVKNRKNHRGTKIDVRAAGDMGPGYIVAPPSTGPKGEYRWMVEPGDGPPPAAPDWLVEWARGDERKTAPAAATPSLPLPADLDRRRVLERATAYLLKCKEAVSGDGGHDATFAVARYLVWGFGLTEGEALGLMQVDYNPRCVPRWSEKELLHKIRDAAKPTSDHDYLWLLNAENPRRAGHAAAGTNGTARGTTAAPGGAAGTPAAPGDGWGDLIPLTDLPPAAAFPIGTLPAPLADFCEAVAEGTGTPVDYAAVPLLGLASALVGATFAVRVQAGQDGWAERPLLYACVVADPSAGKTPAQTVVERPAVRASAGRGGPPTFITDTTVEALVPILRERARGVGLTVDEMAGWVGGFNQYKGGKGSDRDFWLSNWTGKSWTVARKNLEGGFATVPHPFVSVLGGTQPDRLAQMVERDDGFLERILWSYPDKKTPRTSRVGADGKEWEAVAGRLLARDLYADDRHPHGRPYYLDLTPDAADLFFDDWCRAMDKLSACPADPRLRGVYPKMKGYVARLSVLRAALRAACSADGAVTAVTDADVAGAVALGRYFIDHARRALAATAGDPRLPLARAVADWVRRKRPGTFGRTQLYAALRDRVNKPEDLADPLRLLAQLNWVRYVEPEYAGTGRKPAPRFEVNPAVYEQNARENGPTEGALNAHQTPIPGALNVPGAAV